MIYGVCDINITFRNLRNIDLYHQGVYYLRTQVYVPANDGTTSSATSQNDSFSSSSSSSSSSTSSFSNHKIPSATRGSRDIARKELKKRVLKHIAEGKPDDEDTRKLRNPQPDTPPMQVAVPHRYLSKPSSLLSRARDNPVAGSDFLMSPATINDREQCFCTRRILVRYIEEEFTLNDSCVFRLEVPLEHNLDDKVVQRSSEQNNPIVTVDLMWVDVEENSEGEVIGMDGSFISVARSVIELHHPEKGTFSYTPILFDDTHFVQIDMLVHSCMHTLKFLPRSASQVVRAVAASSVTDDFDGEVKPDDIKIPLKKTGVASNETKNSTTSSAQSKTRSRSTSSSLETNGSTLAHAWFPPPATLPAEQHRAYFSTPHEKHIVNADSFHRVYLDSMLVSYRTLHTYMKEKVTTWLKSSTTPATISEREDKMAVLLSVLDGENLITKGTLLQSISSRAQSISPNTLSSSIQYDMNCMSMENLLLYHQLVELTVDVLIPMTADLRQQWEDLAVARAHESIFHERMSPNDYTAPRTSNGGQAIGTLAAKQLRKDANMARTKVLVNVEDEQLFGKRSDRPLFFATSYDAGTSAAPTSSSATTSANSDNSINSINSTNSMSNDMTATSTEDIQLIEEGETKETSSAVPAPLAVSGGDDDTDDDEDDGGMHSIHLIVFQHGYQGTSYDLRLFRDIMKFILSPSPKGTVFSYLIASSNERQTDGNIEMMGHRLATEVANKITSLQQDARVVRLSFIGHSLGSVIIRSALTSYLLTPFLNRLWSFVSLTSPHVGFFFAPGIVNTAVWFLKRWHKSLALEQLSLSDEKDVNKTFFYRLSEASAPLSNFHHVVLVGSHQDNYAPYHSARIEMTKEAMNSTESSPSSFLKAMLSNILQHIAPSKLVRIDVDFKLEGMTVDNSIGRAAHIRFLDSFQLTFNFILGFRHLWEWEKKRDDTR